VSSSGTIITRLELLGRASVEFVSTLGYAVSLLFECVYWLAWGWKRGQRVRLSAVVMQMMEIGVHAIPIVAVLSATIGIMLAIQGIYTLKAFGAESRVVIGVAFSVVREFSPLITAILVAGRSGSALAARLATMKINQEIDAQIAMAINPVRFIVVPALVAMLIMLPALTFFADLVSLYMAGLYVQFELGLSLAAYAQQTIEILSLDDLMHGLGKSILFSILITLIAVVNGASVVGGAEGVGRATTRSVVHAITAIVITDMLFALLVTR